MSTDDRQAHRCTERCSLPSGGCVFALLRANPDGLTLEEVGRVFGLTRERIRQIEAEALEKLRRTLRHLDDARPAETPKRRGAAKPRGTAVLHRPRGRRGVEARISLQYVVSPGFSQSGPGPL